MKIELSRNVSLVFIKYEVCQQTYIGKDIFNINQYARYFKGASMQRCQCPIYNGILETFV